MRRVGKENTYRCAPPILRWRRRLDGRAQDGGVFARRPTRRHKPRSARLGAQPIGEVLGKGARGRAALAGGRDKRAVHSVRASHRGRKSDMDLFNLSGSGGARHRRQWRDRPGHGRGPRRSGGGGDDCRPGSGQERGGGGSAARRRRHGGNGYGRRRRGDLVPGHGDGNLGRIRPARRSDQQCRHRDRQTTGGASAQRVERTARHQPYRRLYRGPGLLSRDEAPGWRQDHQYRLDVLDLWRPFRHGLRRQQGRPCPTHQVARHCLGRRKHSSERRAARQHRHRPRPSRPRAGTRAARQGTVPHAGRSLGDPPRPGRSSCVSGKRRLRFRHRRRHSRRRRILCTRLNYGLRYNRESPLAERRLQAARAGDDRPEADPVHRITGVPELCPVILGHSQGREKALTYQFGGESEKGLPAEGQWRCLWLSEVGDILLRNGPWHAGDRHKQPQGCVEIVDLDVNPASPYRPKREMPLRGDKQPSS